MNIDISARKRIIILAVIISLIMYFAGVFSGLYANKIIEKKVEKDIDFLRSYIDNSALDLKNILLLQVFTDNVEDECRFSELYLSNLKNQLEPYWQKLPSRLEAYEKEGKISDEYITLKREYTRLSLRIWLIAKNTYKSCEDSNFVPLLYFFSKDCETCVRQGEILDLFREEISNRNKTAVVFPIDETFEDDTVFLLKQYYNITKVPAIILNGRVIQSDVIPLNILLKIVS